MHNKILALYSLKFNPFTPDVPIETLHKYPQLADFCWRIEHSFIKEGGFALVSGDPGTGKSVALRVLADQLANIRDIQVGVLTYASAKLSDFYRELGDLFGVPFSGNNRWMGFKSLRLHWKEHFKTTFFRPVLFIDESQELPIYVLNELRLLTSAEFDSRLLLNVILAGDQRLNEKFRHPDLAPLGSRIRMRFNTVYAMPEELLLTLDHMVTTAGNPRLMTSGLMQTVCEHAMGNYRALAIMGGELLAKAAQLEQPILDEKLFFECYPQPTNSINKRKKN